MKRPFRAFYLGGSEEALRRRALAEAFAEAGVAPDDFDVARFEAGESSPEEWLGAVSTAPFFGTRRAVVVRRLLRASPPPKFGEALAALPDFALLILVADEEAGDDARRQRAATAAKAWEKAAAGGGARIVALDVPPRELLKHVGAEAARLGKRLTPRAAQLLAEMTGGSLSRAIEELEKLAMFVGPAETIQEGDVAAATLPSREWNVFKLSDAIAMGNSGEALRQLRILVESPQRAEEAAFRSILPVLSRQLRLLWQARMCLESGASPAQRAADFPAKPNLAAEPPYRQSSIMASARRASFTGLASASRLLADADARLKGLLPAAGASETLEQMVLGMVAALGAGA